MSFATSVATSIAHIKEGFAYIEERYINEKHDRHKYPRGGRYVTVHTIPSIYLMQAARSNYHDTGDWVIGQLVVPILKYWLHCAL